MTYSPGPQAMHDLVAAAVARGDVVVSVGGDGMLCRWPGRSPGSAAPSGIVPAGRGNDFARMLGLPDDPAGVRRTCCWPARSAAWTSSPGRSTAARGWWPARSTPAWTRGPPRSSTGVRWLPGPVQYPYAAVRALATYRPARFRVVVDGVVGEYDAATVVVANSRYYGKGMAIAPAARLDDGLLDVVVIEAASKRELIRSLPKVYDGRHVDLPEVTVLTGARVEISADARWPVPVGADGEPLGRCRRSPPRRPRSRCSRGRSPSSPEPADRALSCA